MTYTKDGDKITLEMTADDYDCLLMALGIATGAADNRDDGIFRVILNFVNRLNATNPNFTPYQLPEETA